MEKICPKCGASSNEISFIGSFCSNCYQGANKPSNLPDRIIIYNCRECGAERCRNWNEESLESSIIALLKDKKLGFPTIEILESIIRFKYDDLDEEFEIKLQRKESICDTCMRRNSNYYEAIIQVRGEEYYGNEEFVKGLINALEKATFISNMERLKEGIDIYVGDKMVARSVLSSMRLKPKVTYKLYGLKEGQRVYRTTFMIRKDKIVKPEDEEEN